MQYTAARYAEKKEDDAYRSYLADGIRLITENTAKIGGGGYLKTRWADMKNPKPKETRTPDEIKAHMKDRLAKLGR